MGQDGTNMREFCTGVGVGTEDVRGEGGVRDVVTFARVGRGGPAAFVGADEDAGGGVELLRRNERG